MPAMPQAQPVNLDLQIRRSSHTECVSECMAVYKTVGYKPSYVFNLMGNYNQHATTPLDVSNCRTQKMLSAT